MTHTQILGVSITLSLLFLSTSCYTSKNVQQSVSTPNEGMQTALSFDNNRDVTSIDPFTLGREFEILKDTTVNYLMPVLQLKRYESDYSDFHLKWSWMQAYPTFHSRLTNEHHINQETIYKLHDTKTMRDNSVLKENTLITNETALSHLIQKCKDEQIVMFNENHLAPHHRILAQIIVDSLYNYGFKHLGIEAIWENDSLINERGFAITNTGFYTREPMMANFIRKAIEKGYYVFGYDDFTNTREKNQALNIYRKTLAKDSLCKVLIWAGHGHISKAEGKMAREFFLLTGIDPLTIEQTEFASDTEYLVISDSSTLSNRRMTCDIFLSNNFNYELLASKSNYYNYSISIPDKIVEQMQIEPYTFIISIFREAEYLKDKRAIPVYNHVLNNNLHEISIKLPVSKYFYVIKDIHGKKVFSGNL